MMRVEATTKFASRRDSLQEFRSFSDFYPHYLAEHSNKISRGLHFVGTSLVILTAGFVVLTGRFGFLWLLPIFGYGFAWIGHFVFEKNKPATFQHPVYSLLGDFVMYRDIWMRRLPYN